MPLSTNLTPKEPLTMSTSLKRKASSPPEDTCIPDPKIRKMAPQERRDIHTREYFQAMYDISIDDTTDAIEKHFPSVHDIPPRDEVSDIVWHEIEEGRMPIHRSVWPTYHLNCIEERYEKLSKEYLTVSTCPDYVEELLVKSLEMPDYKFFQAVRSDEKILKFVKENFESDLIGALDMYEFYRYIHCAVRDMFKQVHPYWWSKISAVELGKIKLLKQAFPLLPAWGTHYDDLLHLVSVE